MLYFMRFDTFFISIILLQIIRGTDMINFDQNIFSLRNTIQTHNQLSCKCERGNTLLFNML
jgi:hypothetical protein